MIFGVLKLKFDEDKAYSLSSQILTKSAKSARETSLSKSRKARLFNKSVKISQHPTHCARTKHADKARDDEAVVDDVFADLGST